MTHRTLAVLVVFNVALLAALSVTVFNPKPAEAQFGNPQQFTMISGSATGRDSQAAVFIVDLASSRVVPVFYNGSSKKFETFTGRTIADDMGNVGDSR